MGALAILVLLVKAPLLHHYCITVAIQAIQAAQVAITHRFRRYLRFALALGAAAGLLILGAFIASALWYFYHCCGTGFRRLNRDLLI
jgi:hypothetical protein